MSQLFHKYQATGNDFIVFDNRNGLFDASNLKLIAQLCDRRFGIGADGLILLENHAEFDFNMVYFNADGTESTMCGNGGRCIVKFAERLGIVKKKAHFQAIDGPHEALIVGDWVHLKMSDVHTVKEFSTHLFLDTGSPHHVEMLSELDIQDIVEKGRKIRHGQPYGKAGTNVNFVKKISNQTFAVRTYERGVEDETLSCGTGVTAVALAMFAKGETTAQNVALMTPGGQLEVSFEPEGDGFKNVWLKGPAEFVFKGEISW